MLGLQLISHGLALSDGNYRVFDINKSGICSDHFCCRARHHSVERFAARPSFTEVAILGYVDFASIILAIGITIIGTGVEATNSPSGLSGVALGLRPKDHLTFNGLRVIKHHFRFTVLPCASSPL